MSDYELWIDEDIDPEQAANWGLSVEYFLSPVNWVYCRDELGEISEDEDEQAYMFTLANNSEYDQCLPFDFGGDSDQPIEAAATVPKEDREEFEAFLRDQGFRQVAPWW